MKKLRILMAIAVLGSMLAAAPAMAAPRLPDASIDVVMDSGVDESQVSAQGSSFQAQDAVAYGDTVTIDWWIDESKLAKKHYITVMMTCVQGDEVVHTNYRGVQDVVEFEMADNWVNTDKWDGGDAVCTATLRYWAHNKMSYVAETTFDVFGTSSTA